MAASPRKISFSKNRNNKFTVISVLFVIITASVYALPNLWGDNPAIIITKTVDAGDLPEVGELELLLSNQGIAFEAVRRQFLPEARVVVFDSVEEQIRGREILKDEYKRRYEFGLNLISTAPRFFDYLFASKLTLGLDLQGGVHLAMKVTSDELVRQYLLSVSSEINQLVKDNNLIVSSTAVTDNAILIYCPDNASRQGVFEKLFQSLSDEVLLETPEENTEGFPLKISLTESQTTTLKRNAIEHNVSAISNRINELGVSEPIVQRQGNDRILVQLPGVQDIARAKKILGSTASLEFRLLADQQNGIIFYNREQQPVMVQPSIIVSGESIVDAVATIDTTTGEQVVSVRLDGPGARRMEQVTVQNLQKPMAVVFKEQLASGEISSTIVSVATIRDVLSSRFQISGLTKTEALDLALFLRSGSLSAPMDIIEEKTIGPTLGAENIRAGIISCIIGLLAVAFFMIFYYRFFGVIAIMSLCVNLILLISILSIFGATLTLPGIAGMVLILGMAVDSNILIYERIKEELASKRNLQESVFYGYNRVFVTIIDSNVTTLIAVLFLFALGSGPVRGFAVTISVGTIATIFCAVTVSRMLVNSYIKSKIILPKWAL